MSRRLAISTFLAACALTLTAGAYDGYQPPNTLLWPLYIQGTNDPRRGIGNSFGEYQEYGSLIYGHTGIDIRGQEGDVVKVVKDSNIWVVVNYDDDFCDELSRCRIYMRDLTSNAERYVYYYAHLALRGEHDDVTAATRAKIELASQWNTTDQTYDVVAGTNLTAGTVLSRIAPFDVDWPHLHFAIVDTAENFDAINPLTAFNRSVSGVELIDDENPVIEAVDIFAEGATTPLAPTWCDGVTGNVDIAATMYDTFYNSNPAPAYSGQWIGNTGVFDARYTVHSHATGAQVTSGTWYTFDRAPLDCAGPDRGNDCPSVIDETDFSAYSFLSTPSDKSGMLIMAESYTPLLFATIPSTGFYDGEHYVHLLTNHWGENHSWNTASVPDGWYQVTVTAKDIDANETAYARFFGVDNDGDFVAPPDAFIKDNNDDAGGIPSTAGGRPFWTSPDIFILPAGAPQPGIGATAPDTLLAAGEDYDVYLRVRNYSCATVHDIGAQVYSANPAMFQDEDDWVWLTDEGEWEGSLDLAPQATGFLGPFPWSPTKAEATSNAGHRCMRAKINSADDPAKDTSVADDNNFTQKNLEFGVTSFDFGNPGLATASVGTRMRCNGFPFWKTGALLELRVAYNTMLWAAWQNVPGTTITLSGPTIVVRFLRCNVTLPSVQLPANTHLAASFKSVVPNGTTGTWVIDLHGYYNGSLTGGMSFRAKAP